MGKGILIFRPRLRLLAIAISIFALTVLFVERDWIRDEFERFDRTDQTPPNQIVTRVFDARDLILAVSDPDDAPDYQISQNNTPTFNNPVPISDPAVIQKRQFVIDELLTSIRDNIAKNSWKENGGSTGAIRELGGQLIVTQTMGNLREVQWRLESLRIRYRATSWLKWLVLVLVLTVCLDVYLQYRNRRNRQRRGECIHCGYDLRASSDRCPECGKQFTPPATALHPAVA